MLCCKGNPFLYSPFKTSFVSFCWAGPSWEIEGANKFTSGIFSDMNPRSQVIPGGRWDSNKSVAIETKRQKDKNIKYKEIMNCTVQHSKCSPIFRCLCDLGTFIWSLSQVSCMCVCDFYDIAICRSCNGERELGILRFQDHLHCGMG